MNQKQENPIPASEIEPTTTADEKLQQQSTSKNLNGDPIMHKSRKKLWIIIALTSIVLLLAAGLWWYYANANKKDTKNTIVDTPVKVETSVDVPKVTTIEYCLELEKLCFNYPSSWKVNAKTISSDPNSSKSTMDKVTINSADGKPVLYIVSGISGLGGVCAPVDEPNVKITETYTTKITGSYLLGDSATSNFYEDTVYAVRVLQPIAKGSSKYNIDMFLTNQKNAVQPGTVNACSIGFRLFTGKQKTGDIAGAVQFSTRDFGTGEAFTPAVYDSEEVATEALNTETMSTAYGILKSAHYK